MLSLDLPNRLPDVTALAPPGGFLWWYVDALDGNGDGFVAIWAYGLPFLPGLASASRRGVGPAPGSRPSVNLAVYRAHRQVAWHLLELDPSEVQWAPGSWRFGPCRMTWNPAGRDCAARLEAELVLPVPGDAQPLRAHFTVTGAAARVEASPLPTSSHRWAPLLPHGHAVARVTHGDNVLLDLDGVGYHDRNESPDGLDALGIDHWTWGRLAFPDRTVIFYLSWPTRGEPVLLVSEALADGRVTVHEATVDLGAPQRGRFGMTWWSELTVRGLDAPLRVRVSTPAEDGPFYLRATCAGQLGDAQGIGWTELCAPARVDRPHERPLVAMTVQHSHHRESMWLPLFAGPRQGRWRRLLRWWVTGEGSGRAARSA